MRDWGKRLAAGCYLVAGGVIFTPMLQAQGAASPPSPPAALADAGDQASDEELDRWVRTGDVAALQAKLEHGLDPARRMYGDWTLAALAIRYDRPGVSTLLRKFAPAAPAAEMPTVSKLPLKVITRGTEIKAQELGLSPVGGEAVVDVYVDADGLPHAAVLRSASDTKLGEVAVANIGTWQFNPVYDNSRPWRRALIPFNFESALPIYSAVQVDSLPECTIAETTTVAMDSGSTPFNAVIVRFVVDPAGKVNAPKILATTQNGLQAAALTAVSGWKYLPAKKGGEFVACRHVEVLLYPGGLRVKANAILPFLTGKTSLSPWIVNPARIDVYKGKSVVLPDAGVALVRMTVTLFGYAKNIKVMASSDAVVSEEAIRLANKTTYESAVLGESLPSDLEVLWIASYRRGEALDEFTRALRQTGRSDGN